MWSYSVLKDTSDKTKDSKHSAGSAAAAVDQKSSQATQRMFAVTNAATAAKNWLNDTNDKVEEVASILSIFSEVMSPIAELSALKPLLCDAYLENPDQANLLTNFEFTFGPMTNAIFLVKDKIAKAQAFVDVAKLSDYEADSVFILELRLEIYKEQLAEMMAEHKREFAIACGMIHVAIADLGNPQKLPDSKYIDVPKKIANQLKGLIPETIVPKNGLVEELLAKPNPEFDTKLSEKLTALQARLIKLQHYFELEYDVADKPKVVSHTTNTNKI